MHISDRKIERSIHEGENNELHYASEVSQSYDCFQFDNINNC